MHAALKLSTGLSTSTVSSGQQCRHAVQRMPRTKMRAHVQITLAYLVLCHLLLYGTSPSYRHELRRLEDVAVDAIHKLSFGYIGTETPRKWRLHPRNGLYRSTELLESVQQGMAFNASSGLYTAKGLVAYMTATDAIKGQGWKAKATLFVQLMAPRYTLLPFVHPSLKPQLRLFSLAAAELPAVGWLAGSEDPTLGFRLTCSSPAMHFSLGPQPIANCSVWPAVKAATPPAAAADLAMQAASSSEPFCSWAPAASAAADNTTCNTCPAGLGLYKAAQSDRCMCCSPSRRSSRTSSRFSSSRVRAGVSASVTLNSHAQQQQQGIKPLALWTIVPASFENVPETAETEAQAEGGELPHAEQQDVAFTDIDQQQLPLLGGPAYFEPPPGGLLSLMASCDAWFIFPRAPLMRLLPAMTGLQQLLFAPAVASYTFLDLLHIISAMQQLHTHMRLQDPLRGRALGAVACAVAGRLMVLLVVRLVVSTALAFGALMLLHQLLRGAVEFAAVVLQPATLKSVALLMGLTRWVFQGSAAAAGSSTAAAAVAGAQAAVRANSKLWSVATGLVNASVPDTAAKVAARLGIDAAGTAAAAGVIRNWLTPWDAHVLAMHQLCEDAVLLAAAVLVWEVQEIVFEKVWKLLGTAAWEAAALVESSAAVIAMLMQGSSWGAAWVRFSQLQQLQQQRRAEAAAAGGRGDDPHRVQAHVFVQVPADLGQAAEALRNLADELEQMGMHSAGLLSGGSRARAPVLGQHWPAALQLPFDAEGIQAELGVEVPRGFICPITQDIMKLPALLISSSVAVPATYDRDAISRWLQGNRRDPKSRQVLASDAQLVPNMDLYRAIDDWVMEKQALRNQQAAAAALITQERADVLESQPRPSNSAGAVCSGLIAAVRGAAAAVRQTRSLPLGQAGRHGTVIAADGGEDDEAGTLLSDEEVEGPATNATTPPAAAAAAAGSSAMCRHMQRQQQPHVLQPFLGSPSSGTAGARRTVADFSDAAEPTNEQLPQRQGDVAVARQYNLRRSRGALSQ